MTEAVKKIRQKTSEDALGGNLSVIDIVFTVLAFNAPLTVVTNFAVLVILYGNGLGAPIAYLAAAITLSLFASGYTAMAQSIPNAGAYYAYITASLGRETGLACATLATLSYSFLLLGIYLFAAVVWEQMFFRLFGHHLFAWWQWAVFLWFAVVTMAHFEITLSAKFLGLALAAEIIIVMAWQGAVIGETGLRAYDVRWATLDNAVSGSAAVALLYALTSFAGFEATAVFREETANPDKTIPAATYAAIAVMGTVFISSIIVAINSIGPERIIQAATDDVAGVVLSSFETHLTAQGVLIVELLLCTSTFACALALHNVIARYIYSLSVDGVISRKMANVHTVHGSPYLASAAVGVFFGTALILLSAIGFDPMMGYAAFSGFGGLGLIFLLLLTSVSVLVFFARNKRKFGIFRTVIAPVLSAIILFSLAGFASKNIGLMTGDARLGYCILLLVLLTSLGAAAYARWLRFNRPSAYFAIGRQNDDRLHSDETRS